MKVELINEYGVKFLPDDSQDGYQFIEGEEPERDELSSIRPYYDLIDDVVYRRFEIIKNSPMPIRDKITKLKQSLVDSDYKWRKIAEAQYRGIEPPYDPDVVIAEAEGMRAQINALEELI